MSEALGYSLAELVDQGLMNIQRAIALRQVHDFTLSLDNFARSPELAAQYHPGQALKRANSCLGAAMAEDVSEAMHIDLILSAAAHLIRYAEYRQEDLTASTGAATGQSGPSGFRRVGGSGEAGRVKAPAPASPDTPKSHQRTDS